MGIGRHSKNESNEADLYSEIPEVKVVIALFSYTAKNPDELSFKKGDYLGIIDDNDSGWWYGCYLTNRRKGYVPSNYVQYPVKRVENEKRNKDGVDCKQTLDSTYEFCYWKLESSRPVMRRIFPEIQKDIEIPHDSLEIVYSIGKGNFGEVFYGYFNKNFEVAIKYLPARGILAKDFLHEVSTMKEISHPHIVDLLAICSEKEPFCIIMEYMCQGNLEQYLKSDFGKELKLPSLLNIAVQISNGMKYLESEKLVYKNLAARNILVGKEDIVKLGDFGLEGLMDKESYDEGRSLLFRWTAPEVHASEEFSVKSDVWSFGVVLYEIFTHGGTPYEGKDDDIIAELLNVNYRMPKPDDPECTDPIYDTMLFCWKRNPDDRPTFEYLFHFFMDYEETSYKSYYRIPFPALRH